MKGISNAESNKRYQEFWNSRKLWNDAIYRSKTRCWDNLLDELEVDGWGRAYKIIRSKFKSPKSNDNELLCEAELRTVVSELFPLHSIISKQQTTVDEEIIPFTQDEVKTISAKMEGLLQIHVLYMKRWDEGM